MNFKTDDFKVYMLYNNDVIRIFNESSYKCRVHFWANNDKTSLLCNAGTGRFVNNYNRSIKLKTKIIKNKKTLLHLDDLQPQFDNNETHQQYLAWRLETDDNQEGEKPNGNQFDEIETNNNNDDNNNDKNIVDDNVIKPNRGWEVIKSPIEHFKTNKDDWSSNEDDSRYDWVDMSENKNKENDKKLIKNEKQNNDNKIKNKDNKLNIIKIDERIKHNDFENSYIFQSKLSELRGECLKNGFVMGYSLIRISDFENK